ncbi:MAG TPA: translational GTPase TypA [Tissierellaceae bacterium]
MRREDIRNIAIIAHVDHGKTTLVNSMLKESGIFRDNQVVSDRVMDSGDIEKERGITILSKNTAVDYNGMKINIIDTPGHADFGGEVERVLNMVDGVVLIVDAYEGPMPQTKFVLRKALDLDLPVVVCLNKIDRSEARPEAVMDEVLDLFIELNASDKQLEAPFVFASAKDGKASLDYNNLKDNMNDLFDAIIENIPAPEGDMDGDLQLLISTIDYNEFIGRIGIGKVIRGQIKEGMDAVIVNKLDESKHKKFRIATIYEFEGLERKEVEEAQMGSIIAISGIEDISIGDTICSVNNPEALPFKEVSQPTLSMTFAVNDSPFAGQEGDFVTSRQLKNRLDKELLTDVSLKVEPTDTTDAFKVSGRGELHLSVLIETMRREGYEFQVSKPEVLFKYENDKKLEPMELVTIDLSSEFAGVVIEKLGRRKGELVSMSDSDGGYTRLEFSIPARGLIGYRQEFMTDTKGSGVMNSIFDGYKPFKGEIPKRKSGSIIVFETGEATAYGLFQAQERGELFVEAGKKVYQGMVVGANPKGLDIEVHVCRKKKQTNVRASGSDDALKLSPIRKMSLEEALEFIEDDELIEITPKNIRIRKRILDSNKRYKSKK